MGQQLISEINNERSIEFTKELNTKIQQKVNQKVAKMDEDSQNDENIQQMEQEFRDNIASNSSFHRQLECEIIVRPLDMLQFVDNEGASDQFVQDLMDDLNATLVSENESGGLYAEPADIDIVVINSGRTQKSFATQNTQNILLHLQKLNVHGPIAISQSMTKYWKHIINEGKVNKKNKKLHQIAVTSSLSALIGTPKMSAYCMTKAGVNRYFEAMRMELVDDNIDINLVCPGPIALTQDSLSSFGASTDDNLRSRFEGRRGTDMTLERCADLYCTALQYSLIESWISRSPPLLFSYVRQYLPILHGPMVKVIGSQYAKAKDLVVESK